MHVKVNLYKNRALYEIVFKNQAIKSKIKALIEKCGEHTCKIVENRNNQKNTLNYSYYI